MLGYWAILIWLGRNIFVSRCNARAYLLVIIKRLLLLVVRRAYLQKTPYSSLKSTRTTGFSNSKSEKCFEFTNRTLCFRLFNPWSAERRRRLELAANGSVRGAAGAGEDSEAGGEDGGHRWRRLRPERDFPGEFMASGAPIKKETGRWGGRKLEKGGETRRRLAAADGSGSRRCGSAVQGAAMAVLSTGVMGTEASGSNMVARCNMRGGAQRWDEEERGRGRCSLAGVGLCRRVPGIGRAHGAPPWRREVGESEGIDPFFLRQGIDLLARLRYAWAGP